jgi:hypothetical protein
MSLVLLQVGHVVVWLIVLQLEKQPTDVCVKKAFRNAIWIIVMIHMFVMTAMFACPHQDRVFKRAGTKNKSQQPDWPACLEGEVREKPMIAYRDAKSASRKHGKEKYHLKPIKPEEPEIERDSGLALIRVCR